MQGGERRAIREQPALEPSSAVVAPTGSTMFGIDPAAVTSIDQLPPELRDNPLVLYAMSMTPEEEAYVKACFEANDAARELYGDESSDAWLEALLDGTHPLCRVPEPARR